MEIFVSNIPFAATSEDIRQLFESYGAVGRVNLITDRETGRPRGFAFVEFDDEESVQKSIALLHGKDLKGRALRVNEAEDRPPRAMGAGGAPSYRPSFGGGGGGGGSYRSGGPPPMLPPADFANEFKKDDRGRSFRGRSTGKPGGGRRNDQKRKKDDVDEDY